MESFHTADPKIIKIKLPRLSLQVNPETYTWKKIARFLFRWLVIWRFRDLAIKELSSLAIWQFGHLASWWFSYVVIWWFGDLVIWQLSNLVIWCVSDTLGRWSIESKSFNFWQQALSDQPNLTLPNNLAIRCTIARIMCLLQHLYLSLSERPSRVWKSCQWTNWCGAKAK